MTKRSLKTIFVILFLCFTTCEGRIHMQGEVKDKETKRPISDAVVRVVWQEKDREDKYEVDTNGKFDKKQMVGCAFGGPDYRVFIEAPGYEELNAGKNIFNSSDGPKTFLLKPE